MSLKFTKWQGCGNDFVLADDREKKIREPARLSEKICDRHYGVGADGLILIQKSDVAELRMRIYNADGSEAEMCGNGIRCFARLVYDMGLTKGKEFTVETGAGVLIPKVVTGDDESVLVRVDMGTPHLAGDEIPVAGFGRGHVIDERIVVSGEEFAVTCVSMGNPHCVVFVDDIKSVDIGRLGPIFERHEMFPRRTNTEFVEVRDDGSLRMRVWERGAAITLACGTGACASLVASSLTGRSGRSARVVLDGGELLIEWEKNDHVYMTGPAEKVFSGEYEGDFA